VALGDEQGCFRIEARGLIFLVALIRILGEGQSRSEETREITWLLDAKAVAPLGRPTGEKESVAGRRRRSGRGRHRSCRLTKKRGYVGNLFGPHPSTTRTRSREEFLITGVKDSI